MSASLEVGDQVAFVVVVEVSIVEHLPEPASGISLHHHLLVVDLRIVVFALVSQHGVDDVNQLVGRGDCQTPAHAARRAAEPNTSMSVPTSDRMPMAACSRMLSLLTVNSLEVPI